MSRTICEDDLDIDPNEIFRPRQASKYFGLGLSQLAAKVASGEIEAPYPLSPSGNAVGWTGAQLIRHHRKRVELAKANRNPNNSQLGNHATDAEFSPPKPRRRAATVNLTT
jgi:hypothetical protein